MAEAVPRMASLEVLQVLSAGVDHVRSVVPDGVTLCNGRGIHDTSTAELTLTLILSSLRGVPDFVRAQDRGEWAFGWHESLADKNVLLVGTGAIGTAIEQRLLPFECSVTRVGRTAREGVHATSELPDLLPEEPEALHILRNGAQNRAEFQRLFAKLIQRWVSGEHDTPELQSWQAYVEQVAGGLQRILEQAHSKQNIAIFTSGGTITALLRLITGVPAEKAFELNWQIVNTSLSLLKFRGSEVSLASFNSHVHLQLLKAPELITYR